MDHVVPIIVFGLVAGLKYPMVSTYLMFLFLLAKVASIFLGGNVGKDGRYSLVRVLSFFFSTFSILGLIYYALKSSLWLCDLIGPDAKAF